MVELSYVYMTTGKTIVLTIWTFINKVISLLFNMLSRFVMAFLPRSKRLNFLAAVTICSDFGAQENKICHCFHCFPNICHEVMGRDAMNFQTFKVDLEKAEEPEIKLPPVHNQLL